MEIQKDKDFTSLPEIAKLYQACKERDLTIAEREYLKGARDAWQAAKAHEAEKLKGCVLVPVQCPDPDFADSLFDELSKKAIGEFGDDLLIHFSDIDEEKIWALMVEAAKAQAMHEGFVLVPKKPDVDKAWSIALKRIVPPPKTNDAIQKELMYKKYVDDLCSEQDRILLDYEAMIEAQEQKG